MKIIMSPLELFIPRFLASQQPLFSPLINFILLSLKEYSSTIFLVLSVESSIIINSELESFIF